MEAMAAPRQLARLLALPRPALLAGGLLAVALLLLARAWVCEDAYITFRVIDNALAGHGLRWNLHERVQVYTHPLWLLLHLPVAALWPNLFHVSIVLSLLCSVGALALAMAAVPRHALLSLALVVVPFVLSKSTLDYASSGLETPLAYLLYAAFGFVVLRLREHRFFWFALSLTVALSLLNRLDTALLFAPCLLWLLATSRRDIRWNQLLLGALPLVAWGYFALVYYGFIFPNTKYAKLDTGLPLALYLTQSLNYVKYLLVLDLPGFLLLGSSVYFIFRGQPLAQMLALGIYCYVLYVLRIGGDYMAGRFWALPIFATIWLWHAFLPRWRADQLFAALAVLAASMLISPMLGQIRTICPDCIEMKGRILNASHTFRANKLVASWQPLRLRTQGEYHFCRAGRKLAQKDPPVEVMFFVGMHAYCAGPQLKAIDMLGLGDALLARLPASQRRAFYIGHFRRDVPPGYVQAVKTGSTDAMHPQLALYYDKLRLITQGDELFSAQRISTIFAFNLGYYDHWKYAYLDSTRR
jgi:arabinofuranosyltransferase